MSVTNRSATSQDNKPLASLSMDLDNQWSYMKTHGNSRWKDLPSYFGMFLPEFLDLLDQLGLKITFFIVGQDAALPENTEYLSQIVERGHEVGNHSFHHESLFNIDSYEQLRKEILDADACIFKATDQKPIGFRGPGFTWNKELLEILDENDYVYDASILPTYLGPFARMYYFKKSNLTNAEKKKRRGIFGNLSDGLKPVKPYYWKLRSGNRLLEIPVTTIPCVRIPFHLSYLLHIRTFSENLMRYYLKMAIISCKIAGISPSFLLHPVDLIGCEEASDLSFFPGMSLNKDQKIKTFKIVMKTLSKHFKLIDMSTYAKFVLENDELKTLSSLK